MNDSETVFGDGNLEATAVFLVDDHEIVRRGLAHLIDSESDIEVVGEAGSAEEALAWLTTGNPDVAVVDVRLGDGNGIDVCREITSRYPQVACLILTSFADDRIALAAAEAGAAAFVLKQVRGRELVDSIRKVANGARLLDDAELRLRAERHSNTEEAALSQLTAQERRVFDLIAEGKTNRQIGEEIFLAEKTIKNYVSSVLSKLGLSRRSEVAAMGARVAERRRQETLDT